MDEQKKDDTTITGTPETETVVAEVAVETPTETAAAMDVVAEAATTDEMPEEAPTPEEVVPAPMSSAPTAFNYKMYAAAVLAILTISIGLIFILEKEGRISTGLFTAAIEKMEAGKKVAVVNGTVITNGELTSSLEQLTQMAGAQGANLTDAAVLESLKQQAIDTLVNGELLRQAAIAAGKTVTEEQITTRYTEIEAGLGGAEQLTARMAEFGVTAESLRRDIENEFLIQELFNEKQIGANFITVTDEEIAALYEQAGGTEAGLPPLAEVKEQVVNQIKFDKEQTQVNELLETLRSEATIEMYL